jgi:Stf0 sulfotransferase
LTRPFLLTFVGRSGSTALMYDLDAHPKTIVHMELFGEPLLPGGREQTDDNRIALLNELWAGYRNPKWVPPENVGSARGFKMQFKRNGVQFDDPPRLAAALRPYDPVVIALRRRDLLRQAISSIRAKALAEIHLRERGLRDYHLTADSKAEARAFATRPSRIDLDELATEIAQFQADQADMEAFHAIRPPTVEIDYEDYLRDRLPALNRILSALGLDPFAEAPASAVSKITDDDLSRAVSNAGEVRAFAAERGLPV